MIKKRARKGAFFFANVCLVSLFVLAVLGVRVVRGDLVYVVVQPVVVNEVCGASPLYVDTVDISVHEIVARLVDIETFVEVAKILVFERIAVVFAVTEEEELFIVEALYYRYLAVVAVRENFKAFVFHHRVAVDIRMAGHRDIYRVVHTLKQRFGIVAGLSLENAEHLLWQLVFFDSVMVFEPRLRSPADIYRRGNVVFRIVHYFFQLFPVRDLFERHGLYGRSRYYHSVEMQVFYLIESLVEFLHMGKRRILAFIRVRVD